MRNVQAYCPASISLIFKYCPHKNLLKMGSVGVGFTVDKGITSHIEKSDKTSIFFNGLEIHLPTVTSALKKVTNLHFNVYLSSLLPLGFGFGLSAASTISTLIALNKFQDLNLKSDDIARFAHISEIENRTGLGTVGTIFTGGFLIKTSPGIPVHARKLPFSGRKIFAIIIDKITTPSILKDKEKLEKINKAATRALSKITNQVTLESILDISYQYDLDSGLLTNKHLWRIINSIKKAKGHASMAKLGKVIISDIKPTLDYNYPIKQLYITDNKLK